MALIITFSISFLGLLLLFISKAFGSQLVAGLDPKTQSLFDWVSFKKKQIIQTVKYIIFIVIPQKTEESFRQAKGAAIQEYKKRKEAVMGKKDIKDSGASFFLKKMKEYQDSAKKGQIQDDNLPA